MTYTVGEYELDPDKHQLIKAGEVVAVEPRTFAVLEALVRSHDTVVTKEDLIDAAWGGRFTSDEAIASRIKDARKALGDDGRAQKYIKTVHGIGYRCVASVQTGPSDSKDSRPTIVVSPFVDLRESDSVAAMGLTHDVIIGLSRLPWLKVISWASSVRLQPDAQQSLRPLTRADYCLSASLEERRGTLSLGVELSDLNDESIVWADRFEGRSGAVNEIRAEIVEQAVNALENQISAAEAAKAQYLHTSDLDAWSNYHLGLLHMYRFNEHDNALATGFFERAIARQANFARAHAGLSFAHFQTVFNRYAVSSLDHSRREAVARAERSVELDSNDPLANFVLGRSHWLSGDVEAGQVWLERTLKINSNFAQAHYAHSLGAVMLASDSVDQAGTHAGASAAIALSPLDPFMYGFFGVRALSYLRDGQLVDARLWANRAARQPNAIVAMDFIAAAANEMAGEPDDARIWAGRARQRSGDADSSYFFRALPFVDGPLRLAMENAFRELGLSS